LTQQISDATEHDLRSGTLSVAALVASFAFALACTEKFTGIEEPEASSGSDAGGNDSETGGKPVAQAGRGGKSGAAGSGGAGTDPGRAGSGGIGGALSVAGIGAGGAVTIEPAPIPEDGLELWLRADQGVVEVGGVVASWKDSSPHQRNATQSEVELRPKLAKDAMTPKSAIAFDGVDDFLQIAVLDADFSGGVSMFAVAMQNEAKECDGIFEASNGPEVEDLHLGTWKGAPLYEVGAPYLHAGDAPMLIGQAQLLTALHEADANAQLRRNSGTLGQSQFELPPVVTRKEVFIGHSNYVGCTTWSGTIAELLVYSRAVSTEELVEIETYLQKKWGCCEE
jgi:hypothetical protein